MDDSRVDDHPGQLLALGRSAQAADELTAALRLDPDNPSLLATLADARTDTDPVRALEPALRAAARSPGDPSILVTLARVLWLTDRWGPARDTIDRAVEVAPGWAEARAVRAVLYLDEAGRGRWLSPDPTLLQQAGTSARRAAELAPAWPVATAIAEHVDRARTDAEPWVAGRLALLVAVSGLGTVLRLAVPSTGTRMALVVAVAILGSMTVTELGRRDRRARAARHRVTRRLLGPAGELAARTRPAPSEGRRSAERDQLSGRRYVGAVGLTGRAYQSGRRRPESLVPAGRVFDNQSR